MDRGFGDYYYKPNYADTNGVIDTFYFGQQENITTAIKGKADSAIINIDENRINKGSARYIWVKDDDGLLRGGRFVVFADSAPKKPDVTFDKPGTGNVTLKFKNLDVKDDSLTQFAIVLGTSETTCNDTLVSWTTANSSTFPKSSGWMTYTFNPNNAARTPRYSSDFYFMVIAKDARETKSKSNNGVGILISYP